MDTDRIQIGWATRGLELAAPVTLSLDDRRRHVLLLGATGAGKTSTLKTFAFDDLAAGRSFAVIDPLGPLAEAVADAVPAHRNDEVIYFNPTDTAHPVGFNSLAKVPLENRHLVADQILTAFAHIWGASLEATPRLAYVLYNGLRLLLDAPGSTLLGLPRLLVDDRYRGRLLATSEDPVIRGFWEQEYASFDERFRVQVIAPVQNKIGMLLAPPALRNILGQRRSTLDIARLMNGGGVLIANLAKGKIGTMGSHLLGALLATTMGQVAETRAASPESDWPDFTLYVDEVQNIATESFASMLSEARNGKVMLVLGHQFLGQLPLKVQQAALANCGTHIVFRVGANDSRVMAAEFGIENESLFSDTQNFSAWARLLQNGNPSEPILLKTTLPESPTSGRINAVIAHTRARHTRERAKVERSIREQLEN